MTLFGNDRTTSILLTIEYMRALLKSGQAMTVIVSKVAEINLYGVSGIFKRIDNRVKKGELLQTVVHLEMANTKNENMKKLLDVLTASENLNLDPALEQLSTDLIGKKDVRKGLQIVSLNNGMSRMITLLVFPMLLFFLYLAQGPAASIGVDIAPYLKYMPVVLAIDLLLLFGVLAMMEARE